MAWSPYGKSSGKIPRISALYGLLGINSRTSGLEKFEGPDPAYWCAQGFAVCNPDARGIGDSEGDIAWLGRQEGQDAYDLIEWLAVQSWCNGKVGMSGTSYLAAAQWFTAAERPPHLAAINPEEGFSDLYRDMMVRGGMPALAFAARIEFTHTGPNRRETIVEETKKFPLVNILWEDKVARFNQITVPSYIVASYSNTLHCIGTFRGWRRIASTEKWLRIHNTQEWPDYYSEPAKADLRRFFGYFLNNEMNGWEETPRVRYSLLDLEGGDRINLAATEFPPKEVSNTKYYLDGAKRLLNTEVPSSTLPLTYEAGPEPGLISFKVRFDTETELVGYPKAKLWVEAKGADDMDLFCLIQKLDKHGSHLSQFTVANDSAMMHDLTEEDSSILRYKGSYGRLRVSARHLDDNLTTDVVPAHTFDRTEKLTPGEVVEAEIEFSPMGMLFYPGEQVRLVIAPRTHLVA